MLSPTRNLLINLTALSWALISHAALAEKIYSQQEQKVEELRIREDIQEKLDWKNRSPEQLDDVPDADRMLLGGLNESILLRQATGERFGLFEGFSDTERTKVIEIRLHKKNKVTDRFAIYRPEICDKGVSIKAEKVTSQFVLYTATCVSAKYGTEHTPYLFDYMTRNALMLELPQHYDAISNKAPEIKLENGIYKMRWTVKLAAEKAKTTYVRNFKILKDEKGRFDVRELPPVDDQIAQIQLQEKLPTKSDYDLPSFVADWGK
jgi:hypothetical protein